MPSVNRKVQKLTLEDLTYVDNKKPVFYWLCRVMKYLDSLPFGKVTDGLPSILRRVGCVEGLAKTSDAIRSGHNPEIEPYMMSLGNTKSKVYGSRETIAALKAGGE